MTRFLRSGSAQFGLPILGGILCLLAALTGSPVHAQTLKVGTTPQAVVFNPVTNKFYIANFNASTVSVITPGTTATVTATVSVGASPAALAVNPVTNKIYVANEFGMSVTAIDGATNATTTVTVGPGPAGIAVNSVTNKIYVSNSFNGTVTMIDGSTNATSTVFGGISIADIEVNSVTNKIYVSGSGEVAVIDGSTNASTIITTPNGSGPMAVNTVTNKIYVGSIPMTVIDGATGAITTVGVSNFPAGIAVNSSTNTVYVIAPASTAATQTLPGTVTVINGATNATSTIPVGIGPGALVVNSANNTIYVANSWGNNVTEIDGTTKATTTVPVGLFPFAIAFDPVTNQFCSANYSDNTVTVSPGLAGTVLPPSFAPAFTAQPLSQTVVSGTTVVFNSVATGSPAPTFQWKLNGSNVSGATSARLVVTAAAATAGTYTCVATNSQGSATSNPATLTISATTNVGRLVNLSVNTTAGKSQVLTVGFVSGGSGTTGNENLLIRATGPALAGLGVPNTLADPTLTVLSGSTVLVANDNWGTPTSNQTAVTVADTATFAFPLSNPASLDAAVAQAFSAGADTVQVSGNTTTSGTALAEVYDNTPTASYTLATPRLINLSAKNQIVAGGSMTAGFVVGGSTSKTVLIRATGPALALLGVTGTIPDPQLALHTTINSQDTVLATNAGWGGDPQITAASNSVFAFPLTNAASADSVVLVTLAPGAYTAVASSASGAAGTVLIEVYEVP